MWNLTSFRLEIVLVSVQDMCMQLMVLLGERPKWKVISVCLEIVLILTQGRCTVCAECTIV
jgi:hypothetical protein